MRQLTLTGEVVPEATCVRLTGTARCASCGHTAQVHWWDDTVGVTCDRGGLICWLKTKHRRVPTRADLAAEVA